MKVQVVVNRNARAFAAQPRRIREVARAAGNAPLVVTESLESLSEVARQLASEGSDRVVLCGGDGTLMAGVTALSRAFGGRPLPEVVPAPGGTVATVARNFGQRAGLLATVARAARGEPLESASRASLSVVDDRGCDRVGFIFGTGLVARFFERYYTAGAGGYATAARIVARVFVGSFFSDAYARSVLDPIPCTLSVDGQRLPPTAYSLLVSSVVRDLGLHMLVTHRAGEDPARPHLVASPLPPRALGPQAPLVLLGRQLRGQSNFDGLVARFRVEFPGAEGPWVLDGDLLRSRSVEVSAGPRIRIAVAS